MWRKLAFLILFSSLSGQAALAQRKLEISPYAGIRNAGGFPSETEGTTFEVQDAATFGVFADYMLTGQLAAEFLWGHTGSSVDEETATVGSITGSSDGPEPESDMPVRELFDLGIDYFHGGLRYDGGNEKYTPYAAGGLGVARFSPDLAGASSLTKFSFSIGAGIIAYLTERIGVRFDARAFGTPTGESPEDLACNDFGCVSFESDSRFWQSHFAGVLMIRF